MKILVTGGLGYIGSHTVVELQQEGYEVVIIDNLSNSIESVLDGIYKITNKLPEFVKLDLRDKAQLAHFFKQHKDITGAIHFASSKAVGESVKEPLHYYENNVTTLIFLLQELKKNNCNNLIFSSSCTVYGEASSLPILETESIKPASSPYGNTKQIGETILKDFAKTQQDFSAIALRYFNPIGAHHTANIGELCKGAPQNLVPYITQTAIGIRDQLSVFGNSYNTKDGTCVRDYIHVEDVAKAHVFALKRLLKQEQHANFEFFNIGTGKGHTVLEVIDAFERATKQQVNYTIVKPREGDVTAAFADAKKANTVLGWSPRYTLKDALIDAWKWQKNQRSSYI